MREPSSAPSPRRVRAALVDGRMRGAHLASAIAAVPATRRDAWLDRVLGTGAIPDDGPDLPPGCVPYLPCGVDTLLRAFRAAELGPSDVLVDVGSGTGRALALAHFLTGAGVIGVEVQAALARATRALADAFRAPRIAVIHGDAVDVTRYVVIGSVFLLYCPFSGARLERVIDDIEAIARTRRVRVCAVDVPLPERAWLTPVAAPAHDVVVYASR